MTWRWRLEMHHEGHWRIVSGAPAAQVGQTVDDARLFFAKIARKYPQPLRLVSFGDDGAQEHAFVEPVGAAA